MNNAATLTHLIGTYQDKLDYALEFSETEINHLARELINVVQESKQGLRAKDVSGIEVSQVLHKISTHQQLGCNIVGEILCLFLNQEISRPRGNLIKVETIVNLLNHPQVRKEDFLMGFSYAYESGSLWMGELRVLPNEKYQTEISHLMELKLPLLRQTVRDLDQHICNTIQDLCTLFEYYSPSSFDDDKLLTSFSNLVDRISTETISRMMNKPRTYKTINPQWSKTYYQMENLVITKYNNRPILVTPPSPYSMG